MVVLLCASLSFLASILVFFIRIILDKPKSNSQPSIPREILLWLHDGMDCETCGLDSPKVNIISSKSTRGIAPQEWIVIDPIKVKWLPENSGIEIANELRTRRVYR